MIQAISREFTLNREQHRAFSRIAWHVAKKDVVPMRMFLGGPGGTGKSRVIDALKAFFDHRGESRRFRLASYTGVAAKNISGMTLHSLLGLDTMQDRGGGKSNRSKTKADLIEMWSGVDYLFIDEVSMIGCELLYDISDALMSAKESSEPFGGITVLFAGDFMQLAPVGAKSLYAKQDGTIADVSKTRSQKSAMGRLLWLGVQDCVLLHEQMHQQGDSNQAFRDLLDNIRNDRVTEADIRTLHS